jgi:hypothetical protein
MPYQPGIIFACIARCYPSEALLSVNFMGRLLILTANIRPCWKGLLIANALAYLASSYVTKKKKFYDIDTWSECKSLFKPTIDQNKNCLIQQNVNWFLKSFYNFGSISIQVSCRVLALHYHSSLRFV